MNIRIISTVGSAALVENIAKELSLMNHTIASPGQGDVIVLLYSFSDQEELLPWLKNMGDRRPRLPKYINCIDDINLSARGWANAICARLERQAETTIRPMQTA